MEIVKYKTEYEKDVIALWEKCELTRPWNNPALDIERKMKEKPELFLVGLSDGKVVASAVGGYNGHRGWVYYLGVDPDCQRRGLGRQMMEVIEERLLAIGCPKINIQVRGNNQTGLNFFRKIGYITEDRVSFGKRLTEDG